jgi:hypothetical protein
MKHSQMHRKLSVARPTQGPSCSSPGMALPQALRTTCPQVLMFNFFSMDTSHTLDPALGTAMMQFYSSVLFFQLVVFLRCIEQFSQNTNLPPALVSIWQGRWQIVILFKIITVCHMFRFPLIWQNRWQTADMWHFCTIKAQ